MAILRILLIQLLLPLIFVCGFNHQADAARLKDIAQIQSKVRVPLLGYGLVVGLDGTGDSKGTVFTLQSLRNMMQRMGISLPPDKVKVKNIAAVMVTGEITPLDPVGGRIDVTVSSLGDASSLQGGMLLLTPLSAPDGDVYCWAQGAISTGGFNARAGGDQISKNYTLVGRIPSGGLIESMFEFPQERQVVKINLNDPDYTTASNVVQAIESEVTNCEVELLTEKNISIKSPGIDITPGSMIQLISKIENLEIETNSPARVVINEKTGTIVAGANVSIDAIALAHGNLTIEIKSTPLVSQPESFSRGQTVAASDEEIEAEEEVARMVYLEEKSNVSELAQALNSIGATSRDIIAIFQALKVAGALHAELIIL